MSTTSNAICPYVRLLYSSLLFGVAAYLPKLLQNILNPPDRTIERFDVDKRFAETVTYNNLVFISGQVGDGSTIEEQTRNALKSVDNALTLGIYIYIFRNN
jgi:enamine deaminase RidA (YjgF/YER057c/UK114 family)